MFYYLHLLLLTFTNYIKKYLGFCLQNKQKFKKRHTAIADEDRRAFNVITEYQNLNAKELKEKSKLFYRNYDVMVLNLSGSLNIGMMIRTACLYGCEQFYVVGSKRFDRRSMVGAQNYIKIKKLDNIINNSSNQTEYNLNNFIDFIQTNNYYPIFVEQGGEDISTVNWDQLTNSIKENNFRLLFIFGSESYGIPESFLSITDKKIISIKQYGILRSLNVAVACGIVLHEYSKTFGA